MSFAPGDRVMMSCGGWWTILKADKCEIEAMDGIYRAEA
jgi:hypothetical protein